MVKRTVSVTKNTDNNNCINNNENIDKIHNKNMKTMI